MAKTLPVDVMGILNLGRIAEDLDYQPQKCGLIPTLVLYLSLSAQARLNVSSPHLDHDNRVLPLILKALRPSDLLPKMGIPIDDTDRLFPCSFSIAILYGIPSTSMLHSSQ